MNRIIKTISNPSSLFGASPLKEVFIPRSPEVVKFTGNLAATHKKMRVAGELEAVNEQMIYKVQYFSRKQRKQFKNKQI